MPTRFPCGICLKPVTKNHKAVKCDHCDLCGSILNVIRSTHKHAICYSMTTQHGVA